MLLHKAWVESRTRFLIIAAALTVFCLFATFSNGRPLAGGALLLPNVHTANYSERIYDLVYSGAAKGMFAILVIFLGLGGLLRERSRRTAGFTLALPASRASILGSQLIIGYGELALLSLLPGFLIPILSRLVQQSYPFHEAIHFSVLWFGCGSLIFAASFLLSVVLPGEYTAPVAGYIVLMLQVLIALWQPLRPYRLNLMWTMGEFGTMRWDANHSLLLTGPLPWTRLAVIIVIAAGFLGLSVKITQHQDF
jgi:ABC-2 type transport system permease protein